MDFAVGKFTISEDRDSVIDYTVPFWYEPAVIVQKKPSPQSLFIYTRPFRAELWLAVAMAVLAISVCVTAINEANLHMQNGKRYTRLLEEGASALWYAYGAAVQQGLRCYKNLSKL